MAWSDPASHVYITGETVTASTMNSFIKDNLLYLYNTAHGSVGALIPTADWSTTSTSFVDWNGTGSPGAFTLTFTKRGGIETALFVDLFGQFFSGTGSTTEAFFAIRVGATDYAGAGVPHVSDNGLRVGFADSIPITGLTAGSYSLKLRVKVQTSPYAFKIGNLADYAIMKVVEQFYG